MFAGNVRYGAPSGGTTTIGFAPHTLTSNVRRGCEAKIASRRDMPAPASRLKAAS
jgi:hypothetical protein